MDGEQYLRDASREFRRLKRVADAALEQVDDSALFTRIDGESNSLATLMKHMGGNMKSRWQGFLSSDGEKPNRNRDAEFTLSASDNRPVVQQTWEEGWNELFRAIDALTEHDLGRSVMIRSESHLVPQAIERQLTHYAYHVGQIVFLARHLVGPTWQSLTIPRGRSEEFAKKPGAYLQDR